MGKRANNTIYFKVMNEDMRVGGILHSLDNSELRTMLILQAYANSTGYIISPKGSAYTQSDLVKILGINWRTVKRTLQSLEDKGLITTGDCGICIVGFVDTQTESDSELRKRRNKDYNNGVKTGVKQKLKTAADITLRQSLNTANKTNILLAEQNKLLGKMVDKVDNKEYVNTDTGEIL